MNSKQALEFVRKHGVVLVSAKGPVPNLADAIAGEPIKGSWWGHAKGNEIFRILEEITDSPDILVCRLVNDKVCLAHKSVWPALVRAAGRFSARRLAQVIQEHTASGKHVNRTVPFPKWVPKDVSKKAASLSEEQAITTLGEWAR